MVCVDGCDSPPLTVDCGVPQGSILGPLLYILFTNDIPDLVHEHQVSYQEPHSCNTCGSTVCYVDDCTYSIGDTDPQDLSEKLSAQYKIISDYMAANHLVINADKTHLIVISLNSLCSQDGYQWKTSLYAQCSQYNPSTQNKTGYWGTN